MADVIAEAGDYPVISFKIESENVAKDVEIATELFNEIVADLAKNKLPFDIKIRSGSVDFVVQILVDFVDQIMADPSSAAIFTGAISGVAGGITQKIFDLKNVVKNVRESKAWNFLANLRRTSNEVHALTAPLPSVKLGKEMIRFSITRANGETIHLDYELSNSAQRSKRIKRTRPTKRQIKSSEATAYNDGLDGLIVRNTERVKLSDLILLALRPSLRLTATEIRSVLGRWGREQGQSFYSSGTLNSLIKRGFVQKGYRPEGKGITQYSLTEKGERQAEVILDKILDSDNKKKPPFVLQRITDRRVRKIRLFYVKHVIERCMIFFNGHSLIWDGVDRNEKTIGKGGGGNVVIPPKIFDYNGIVTVEYDGERYSKKYRNLVEAPA